MNFDHDFFSGEQIKWRQKKKEHFISPNSSGDLHSDADQSQIIWGGDADVDHTQIIGEIYLPSPSPPPPPGFWHPWVQ